MYSATPSQSQPTVPVVYSKPPTSNQAEASKPQVEYDVSHVAVLGYN